MNTATSLPTTAAPVITYKKVYSQFFGEKLTRVFVDGVAKYDIMRFSPVIKGFDCYTLEPNDSGTLNHGHFVCGGADVLLREVKAMVEGIVFKAYTESLNDTSTQLHKQAVEENFDAMQDAGYAIQCVEDDTVITAIDGDEVPTLLNETFDTIRNAGMTTPAETLSLREFSEVIEQVYQAQQVLKDAAEALQALRDRAKVLGTNNDKA